LLDSNCDDDDDGDVDNSSTFFDSLAFIYSFSLFLSLSFPLIHSPIDIIPPPCYAMNHIQGRVSGVLATVPVFAVLAEDVGQRGAYRVAYQQFLAIAVAAPPQGALPAVTMTSLSPPAAASSEVVMGGGNEKKNKLILLAGVLTTLLLLGSKSRKHY
jgi:hypothetical protein